MRIVTTRAIASPTMNSILRRMAELWSHSRFYFVEFRRGELIFSALPVTSSPRMRASLEARRLPASLS